jgi:hypothetical protein
MNSVQKQQFMQGIADKCASQFKLEFEKAEKITATNVIVDQLDDEADNLDKFILLPNFVLNEFSSRPRRIKDLNPAIGLGHKS